MRRLHEATGTAVAVRHPAQARAPAIQAAGDGFGQPGGLEAPDRIADASTMIGQA